MPIELAQALIALAQAGIVLETQIHAGLSPAQKEVYGQQALDLRQGWVNVAKNVSSVFAKIADSVLPAPPVAS